MPLLIYGKQNTAALERELNSQRERYHLKAKLPLNAGKEKIIREINRHESVMLGDMSPADREFYIQYCYEHKKRCYCQTTLSDILLMSSEKLSLSDMSLQLFRNCGLTVEQRIVKRLFDICLSLLVMTAFSWLYLLIALFIKLTDGESVLTCTFSTRHISRKKVARNVPVPKHQRLYSVQAAIDKRQQLLVRRQILAGHVHQHLTRV